MFGSQCWCWRSFQFTQDPYFQNQSLIKDKICPIGIGGGSHHLTAEMPLDGIRSHFDYTLPDRRCEQFISSNRVLLPIMHYVHYVKRFDPNSRMVSGNP